MEYAFNLGALHSQVGPDHDDYRTFSMFAQNPPAQALADLQATVARNANLISQAAQQLDKRAGVNATILLSWPLLAMFFTAIGGAIGAS